MLIEQPVADLADPACGVAGRGRGDGVAVDSPVGAVWDLRGGKIWRLRAYLDHEEALRVAGLAE